MTVALFPVSQGNQGFTRKLVNNFKIILSDMIFECCFLIFVVDTTKTNPTVCSKSRNI